MYVWVMHLLYEDTRDYFFISFFIIQFVLSSILLTLKFCSFFSLLCCIWWKWFFDWPSAFYKQTQTRLVSSLCWCTLFYTFLIQNNAFVWFLFGVGFVSWTFFFCGSFFESWMKYYLASLLPFYFIKILIWTHPIFMHDMHAWTRTYQNFDYAFQSINLLYICIKRKSIDKIDFYWAQKLSFLGLN